MHIDLSGIWTLFLETETGAQTGTVVLPGILQAQGYGNAVSQDTPWVSSLHDSFWYEQEEYKAGQENGCKVPFLAQPPLHFLGMAFYVREFEIMEDCEEEWFLRIEQTHWRTKVWVDESFRGEDCSLCTAHEIPCGQLQKGKHVLKVCIDNSMQYSYRPDGHGVSDALGATWNGMAGEILLETASDREKRRLAKKEYALAHPRHVEAKDGCFYVDGRPEYFRATHFGGEYPLTGYPSADRAWWQKIMRTVKAWGLNAIRCHSNCPPELAFQVADEENVYFLVECGMWNQFEADAVKMQDVLRRESRRILEQFGHHPSFAFFSPSNEPGGNWYQPLRDWVKETKEYDVQLGYAGRRLYTAQSGWFYDVPPADITGTDFIYFHRSGYGIFLGGKIRGADGWRGGDYSSSLEGARLPVVCHELGQWCAYPDFGVIEKFTGYLRPGNYQVFRAHAARQGLLPYEEDMVRCSGRSQLRLYKEELEANFRTPEISGFELLDLHDYLGQGTALVGFLDPFWDSKGYASPEEFREFCGETVLLIRCPSYVWRNTQKALLPVEVSHYGREDLYNERLMWQLQAVQSGQAAARKAASETAAQGHIDCAYLPTGQKTKVGAISLDFSGIRENTRLTLTLRLGDVINHWDLYVYAEKSAGAKESQAENQERVDAGGLAVLENQEHVDAGELTDVENQERAATGELADARELVDTHDWHIAREALAQGKAVVYSPWLSDLDYECPALSVKNVFWNSQMGPTWGRALGMIVEEAHPLFRSFPTERSGGWQWEDILDHARGFHLKGMEQVKPIVRIIDDWNRSLPLALILEAKVGRGRLLLVSADLEGSFEERPAAYSLKQAILQYAGSEAFCPQAILTPQQIEAKLFPVCRMEALAEKCSYDGETAVRNGGAIFDSNPQTSVRMEKKDFPVTFTISLHKVVKAKGFLYLPQQRDRAHEGFLRDYRIEYLEEGTGEWKEAVAGTFLNTSLSQKTFFAEPIMAGKWRFTVNSCYGCEEKEKWIADREGWHKVTVPGTAVLQIAGLQILCEEESAHSNRLFWDAAQRSATKEIEA